VEISLLPAISTTIFTPLLLMILQEMLSQVGLGQWVLGQWVKGWMLVI
jgi:hypothetical protein